MQYINLVYAVRTPLTCLDFACFFSDSALEIFDEQLPTIEYIALDLVLEVLIKLDHYPNMTQTLPFI